jgi:hypothetical protein
MAASFSEAYAEKSKPENPTAVRGFGAEGTINVGDREIHGDEAAIVHRVRGRKIPRQIAFGLNRDGISHEMIALGARENVLSVLLTNQPTAGPALHPNRAEIHHEKVADLYLALSDPGRRTRSLPSARCSMRSD